MAETLVELAEYKEVEFTPEEQAVFEGIVGRIEMFHSYKEQVVEVYDGKKYYSDAWNVTIEYRGVLMELTYTQGSGWHGEEPLLKNVLHSVLSDYHGYKDSTDFEDYCSLYGMDIWEEFECWEDEEEAEDGYNKKSKALYELVMKQAGEIENLFTEEEIKVLGILFQDY